MKEMRGFCFQPYARHTQERSFAHLGERVCGHAEEQHERR